MKVRRDPVTYCDAVLCPTYLGNPVGREKVQARLCKLQTCVIRECDPEVICANTHFVAQRPLDNRKAVKLSIASPFSSEEHFRASLCKVTQCSQHLGR